MGWKPGVGIAVVLVVLVGGLPSTSGVIAPVAYDDQNREAQVHHGVAHQDSEDRWERSVCANAFNTYHLELSIPEEYHTAPTEPRLELRADHYDQGWMTRSAIATPSQPATLDLYQGCYYSVEFTVIGQHAPVPTKYTVECTGGCYSPATE